MSWYWSHTETIKCVGEHTWVVSFSGVSRILVRDTGRICLQKNSLFLCPTERAELGHAARQREEKKSGGGEPSQSDKQDSNTHTHTYSH